MTSGLEKNGPILKEVDNFRNKQVRKKVSK